MSSSASFPLLVALRKTGNEPFISKENPTEITLLDFWQWSVSDLASNTTRGRLAEFLVASALGLANGVRTEWDAYDLCTSSGLRIEVKSSAYLQSWYQAKPSSICFSIAETRAWDAATNVFASESRRQAHAYVFALLAHQDKPTLDPLNLDQWHFYAVLTLDIERQLGRKKSITFKALQNLCPSPVSYAELAYAISRLETQLTSERS
jgi:hypothetical protein